MLKSAEIAAYALQVGNALRRAEQEEAVVQERLVDDRAVGEAQAAG